jgi:hypothetical protein
MIRLEAVSDERAESSREPRRRRERGQIYFLRRDAKNRFVTHSKKKGSSLIYGIEQRAHGRHC